MPVISFPHRPGLDFNDFRVHHRWPGNPQSPQTVFLPVGGMEPGGRGSTDTNTVPTMQDRQGNLAGYCAASLCLVPPSRLIWEAKRSAGKPWSRASRFRATSFRQVSSAPTERRWSPTFTSLPLPSTLLLPASDPYEGGYNFNTLYNNFANTHMTSVKVDYIINDRNHLAASVRHYLSPQGSAENGTGAASALI